MKVLLIGCGNIGSILLTQWSEDDSIKQIVVVQPSLTKKKLFVHIPKISFVNDSNAIDCHFQPEVIVIAIKPQNVKDVLPQYIHFNKGIFISLCVALSVKSLLCILNENTRVIRLMPNIAISVSQSTNLVYSTLSFTTYSKTIDLLFKATGTVLSVNNEELLDNISPITGSAPAYFYLLAEELMNNAINYGLDSKIAFEAVKQTLIGSAALLVKNIDNFSTLKNSVTSKGGVTEAALGTFNVHLPQLVESALQSAIKRLNQMKIE